MPTQFKPHKFHLDLGPELGKREIVVSHKKMLEILGRLFPDYGQLGYREKKSAWKETRRVVYNSLKRKYSPPKFSFSRIEIWRNPDPLYTTETSHD